MGDEPGKISSGSRIREGLECLVEEFEVILEGMESWTVPEEENGGTSTDWEGGPKQCGGTI